MDASDVVSSSSVSVVVALVVVFSSSDVVVVEGESVVEVLAIACDLTMPSEATAASIKADLSVRMMCLLGITLPEGLTSASMSEESWRVSAAARFRMQKSTQHLIDMNVWNVADNRSVHVMSDTSHKPSAAAQ